MTRHRLLLVGWLTVLGLTALLPLSALLQGVVHAGAGTLVEQSAPTKPVIAFGSTVVLRHGSRSIVVDIGGDIRLHGHAGDDLVDIGGQTYLYRGSTVAGDILSILGGIYRSPGVAVSGRIGGSLRSWNGRESGPTWSLIHILGSSIRLGLAAGLALLLAGTCLTVVFPWQVVLISSTLKGSPLKSLAAGVMIALTFMFLVIPLGLSLAGLPFALLLSAAASLAWLFGMTSAAVVLGRLVSHTPSSLLWTAAAGLVTLAIAMAVPLVGPLAVTLIGIVGAGALAVALIGRARPTVPLA